MDPLYLILVVLAVFWAWQTLRYAWENLHPSSFFTARPVHPFLPAGFALYLVWPDWVAGLAIAGVVGMLVTVADWALGEKNAAPVYVPQRNTRSGLPPLP